MDINPQEPMPVLGFLHGANYQINLGLLKRSMLKPLIILIIKKICLLS